MRKVLIALALAACAAVPAAAQQSSIGVYFNAAGTQSTATLNGGYDELHTAYVIGFGEMLLGGAAFKLDLDPRIVLVNATFPVGVQIGDLVNGIEIGFQEPEIGFFGRPVRLATLTLFTGANLFANAQLGVSPYLTKYNAVVVADGNGNLFEAEGRTAFLTIPVPSVSSTWGQVKGLYQ